jgi:UDP-glucuronate 4-epimerase
MSASDAPLDSQHGIGIMTPAAEPILVTGVAGFIGFSLARRLLESGKTVVGIDSVNSYYDPALKEARLARLGECPGFTFHRLDLADRAATGKLFASRRFPFVVHLAAQAGVRYSLQNPHAYLDANLAGFLNVLEGCRDGGTRHLIYASSSSVYGANTRLPFSVHHNVDHPISLYAATKKANESMAHAYSKLYGLPATGLRFFTVYGPWGRPDMAMFIFTKAILEGRPIQLFNHGRMRRDFTYIDDIVEAMERLLDRPPAGDPNWSGDAPDPSSSAAPWRLYNIGNNRAVEVVKVVDLLEIELGRTAVRELVDMQPGDVPETCADVDDLMRAVGFAPATPIEEGIARFVSWYRDFYRPS